MRGTQEREVSYIPSRGIEDEVRPQFDWQHLQDRNWQQGKKMDGLPV